jgi:hypothetical protein
MNLLDPDADPAAQGTNHLIGLCHDLGDLILRQHFKAEYEQILGFATTHNLPLRNVQASALGIRHAELLTRLLGDIGLPDGIVQVIQEFADSRAENRTPALSPTTRLLAAADSLAHGLLLAPSAAETVAPITRAQWRSIAADRPAAPLDPNAKRSQILAATNLLARLPAAEERRLMTPLLPRLPLRICYLRPEGYIPLDPLASALSLLTKETVIHTTLPPSDQLAPFDAVIAVGIRVDAAPVIPTDLLRASQAARRPGLPILALVGNSDLTRPAAANPASLLTLRTYPISLDRLHQWLAAVTPASGPRESREMLDREPVAV